MDYVIKFAEGFIDAFDCDEYIDSLDRRRKNQ